MGNNARDACACAEIFVVGLRKENAMPRKRKKGKDKKRRGTKTARLARLAARAETGRCGVCGRGKGRDASQPVQANLESCKPRQSQERQKYFAKSPKPIRQRVHKAPVRSRISSAVPEKSSRLLFCRRRGKRRRWKPQGTDNRPWRPIRFDCDAEQPVCASDEAPEQPTSAANAEGPEES